MSFSDFTNQIWRCTLNMLLVLCCKSNMEWMQHVFSLSLSALLLQVEEHLPLRPPPCLHPATWWHLISRLAVSGWNGLTHQARWRSTAWCTTRPAEDSQMKKYSDYWIFMNHKYMDENDPWFIHHISCTWLLIVTNEASFIVILRSEQYFKLLLELSDII